MPGAAPAGGEPVRDPRHRWSVCALLFAITTINYMDRQLIGLLKPLLQGRLGWSEIDYGNIVLAFQAAYAVGLVASGWALDRLGTRRGFSIAAALWSVAAMAHALTRGVPGFIAARFGLGLGESANFPAAIKVVAEWFPRNERALATGIFNAGSTVGALITPLLVPFIVATCGWRMAFVLTGALGFVWIALWLGLHAAWKVRDRPDAVHAANASGWRDVLPHRATWAFALAKFLTDPIWWLYLFWLPDFFARQFHLDLQSLSLPTAAVYLAAGFGSVAGGAISSWLIGRGVAVYRARKAAMLLCALAVTPVWFAPFVTHPWPAVAMIGLAAAAHQGWSANLLTTVSDMFPQRMVSSVTGFGSMFGAVGGMLVAWGVAHLLQLSGSYAPVFFVAGGAYLAALAVFHALAPGRARQGLSEAGAVHSTSEHA
ncbi:MFS transporter [Rhodanobacter sp. DHB23]|uniref:MFS transporter n=1 Tax=Rhodanobacter sp. DHB23 TaxID=2775923 RepID=UPI00177D8903|nr:MFS transporter [Rhodanobacter sp. DHB23]MBD8873495.1 MFS transporter [Rhodanobacter sp. DHB23]